MTDRHVPAADSASADRSAELPYVSVEFAAFCELHEPRYRSYARVWFQEPGAAHRVVRLALHAIAAVWPTVLESPNPAAEAWQILRDTVTEQHNGTAGAAGTGGLRPDVEGDEDLAILHYVVGLATPEIADVMGGDTASITSQLRQTHRRRATDW
ncbi:hypothetical protein EDD38_2878 [Kitasatospora cineracea]|uniref:DNA-directed RNA polymerase specialized sigma24 family protein n=1 Tax=Kitasatospora cineracea TaxID=88074 RepID=A0A3N4S1E9_9ACTN|nr:hypothetical protein EDD39_2390 [Kitasatospora cineracea]RPE34557.1 hypothetical protein EDD38_2878 [Kitasatospora cineracea]